MKIGDLKRVPCKVCGGPENVMGSGYPRNVFYFTERIEVRCMKCGAVETFKKRGVK